MRDNTIPEVKARDKEALVVYTKIKSWPSYDDLPLPKIMSASAGKKK